MPLPALPFLFLIGLAGEAGPQTPQPYRVSVGVDLVVLQHEEIPVTVGLVVDHSGSMRRKLTEAIAAARIAGGESRPGRDEAAK
ncbi:hypothetical protein SBA4_540003 [Candidatus Sulfopaludibacter sp. SbA4]|nr:hypothetical protein SBA4_540003 [Candidatus Sulfopaludibacter sp. SbA4]